MKIKVSGFDAEIVSTLIIWCDECRPPDRHPRGGSIPIQKLPCPPCLAEALKRESIVKSKIFMDLE